MRNVIGIFLVSLIIFACNEFQTPSIVTGREWNLAAKVVADTTSEFSLSDPVFFQFRYGKAFDFPSLEWSVREVGASGKELIKRNASVTKKDAFYTVMLKNSAGEFLSARQFFRTKNGGDFIIEFRDFQGILLASKQVRVISSKK